MLKKLTLKKKIILLLGVFGLGMMIFTLFLNAQITPVKKKMPEADSRPVKYMVLEKRNPGKSRIFPGMVDVAGETKLSFRVSGPLHKIHVETGQRVKKGQIIAQIDQRDFKLNLIRLKAALAEAQAGLNAMENGARKEDIDALKAQLEANRANLVRSKNQKERFDKLVQNQFVTKAQHDEVIANFKTSTAQYDIAVQNLTKAINGAREEDVQAARARIKQLKANITAAEYSLADTDLKAPFDGVINKRLVEKHETIAAGTPVITILDCSSIDVKTAIPEEMLLKRHSFKNIICTFDAYPNRSFSARIREIGLKTDSANQSFPLTVSLDTSENIEIQAGMTASVRIEYTAARAPSDGFFVPNGSVFSEADNQLYAWKINTDTHTVSKVKIHSRNLEGDRIFIQSKLKEGDLLVTAGAKFLIQDQKIRLLEEG